MVRILDVHSDPDHHRSVLTAAGPAVALVDAMVSATREAARLIDLRTHEGAHPRLGAMDVVPFVPVLGSTMGIAVEAATRTAERIATQLGIPCFLYGEAARSPERRSLPSIRKRAFIEFSPDFGPPTAHRSAGATVVGARGPIVAYNVNLAATDVAVASRIARRVRSSGGGLPHLRAMGVELRTRRGVQVSMTLTHPVETTIGDAFDAVATAAGEAGVDILESELVGLAPRAALAGRSSESLRLEKQPKILEEILAEAFP